MSEPNMMRVLIADDHPLVLAGFASMIRHRPDFSLVGEFRNGKDAFDRILSDKPDLAVLDCNMPMMSGVEVLEAIMPHAIPVRGILISAAFQSAEIARGVAAGAAAILRKDAAPDELIECLTVVSRGGTWLPAQTGSASDQGAAPDISLTIRERAVAELAAEGRANKNIAHALGLSEGTVKVHLYNIYKKARLSNRTELANLIRPK